MRSKRQLLTRRLFLAGGLSAAAGAALAGAWVAGSSAWPARFLREYVAEMGREIPPAPERPEPGSWLEDGITVAWLGHATVLINFLGVRVLVDPALQARIGINLRLGVLGPQRLVAPALSPGDLPEVDLVLVSHAHFDHLDIPSLRAVRGRPALITAPKTADLIPRRRYASVQELRWNESARVATRRGEVRVRAIEVNHWGARVRRDTHRGYVGYVLEREGRRLLLGGDTADTPLFAAHRSLGPFDAAIMPIGAYDPWIHAHCTPEQAVAMADAAGARLFLPIHHQTFVLSREPVDEPIQRALDALASEPERIPLQTIGQTVTIT